MIASFVEGRIRLRASILTNPESMNQILAIVGRQDGVLESTANCRTGSLLILYDPQRIGTETLLAAVTIMENFLAAEEKKHPVAPPKNNVSNAARAIFDGLRHAYGCGRKGRTELRLLGLSGLFNLAGLLFSRRVHVAAGTVFAVLAARHMLQHRGRL